VVVADRLGLPGWLSLRPVVGFRYQKFQFLIHDGTQYDYYNSGAVTPLPGNLLAFRQEYFHYFAGLRSQIDAGRYTGLADFKVSLQVDCAYVNADNKDHHLLRGDRFTYDTTDGYAWHASVGLKKSLIKNLYLGVHADYMKIRTTGTHRMVYREYNADISWSNGVKVWSEQTAVGMTLEYRF
jgi:outer membrane protease